MYGHIKDSTNSTCYICALFWSISGEFMSVALVAHYLGPQLGIGQFIDRLLPPLLLELKQRDIEYTVLASPNAANSTPVLQAMDDVDILPELDRTPLQRWLWIAAKFDSYCISKGITAVVWLSNPMILPWHPRSLAVIHDVNEWKNLNKGLIRTLLRSLVYLDVSMRCAARIVSVSRTTHEDIAHFRPKIANTGKITTVLNGSDSNLVMLPGVDISLTDNPYLISVGRIDPEGKKLYETVEFVDLLRDLSSVDYELHFVGGLNRSSEKAGLKFLEFIEKTDWIRYHGYVDNQELAERYRRSEGVLFLAEHEGFGLPIAEAHSFGKLAIVNINNTASFEAGGDHVLAISLDNLEAGVNKFIETAAADRENVQSFVHTWDDAAKEYAELINLTV